MKLKWGNIAIAVYLIASFVLGGIFLRARDIEYICDAPSDRHSILECIMLDRRDANAVSFMTGIKFIVSPVWAPAVFLGEIIL